MYCYWRTLLADWTLLLQRAKIVVQRQRQLMATAMDAHGTELFV